jgi:enoyl-CoA hydratase/carnithine racemase
MLADECTLTYGLEAHFVRHWHSERMPIPRPMTVEQLGCDVAPRLTDGDRPARGLGLVDLSVRAPAELVSAACRVAREGARVLVGVSDVPPDPAYRPLMEELACTLVAEATESELDATCVATTDLDADVDAIGLTVAAAPIAAISLGQLLGMTAWLSVPDGLIVESLAYSTLLAGAEFRDWRERYPARPLAPRDKPVVSLERAEALLTVTLDRPDRHNAYDSQMRDELIEALAIAVYDESVARIVVQGAGASFCSGGDLDEFGTARDVAAAHVLRVTHSAGALLHALRDRVEARVHGACIGAGVELPAFCGSVVAHDDAFFQLPEVTMGLVPGAGGTVSVTRRIGRWRTAYLALSACRLDVDRALEWGLVDRRAEE